jgi:hypothetical protein
MIVFFLLQNIQHAVIQIYKTIKAFSPPNPPNLHLVAKF